MWPDLCNPIISSAVKLKLGHNFSELINRFKIGTFHSWTKDCPSKFFPIHKGIKN